MDGGEREQGRVGKKEVEEGRDGGRAPCGKAICWPGDEGQYVGRQE